MRKSNHSSFLAVALLSAAVVGSCGGKVETTNGAAGSAGKGGTVANTGGTGGGGKGGQGGQGGYAKGGSGGTGWGGGDGTGGSGWGGTGAWDGSGAWGGGGQGGGYGGGYGGGDGAGAWGGYGGGTGGTMWIDGGSLYGMITEIKFNTPFLLDNDKLNDNTYIQQHGDAIVYSPSFFGYYGLTSKPIPPPSGQTISYGVHSLAQGGYPPSIQITQYTVTNTNQTINPLVEFYFASDKINPGSLEVGMTTSAGAYLVLYNSLQQGQDYCAIAVGFGTVQITQSVKTTQPDGGILSFDGVNLPLYYPTETPVGDVSSMIGTVCPKE